MQETQIQSLGLQIPLEKEIATHSSLLAWRIPRTEEETGKLLAMGRESRTHLSDKHFHFHCLMNHFLDCDNAQGLPRWLCLSVFRNYIYKGKVHSFSFFLKF